MPYRRNLNTPPEHDDEGMRCVILTPRYTIALLIIAAVFLFFADGSDASVHARPRLTDSNAESAVMQWLGDHNYEVGEVRRVRRGHGPNGWTLVDVRWYMGTDDSGPIDFEEYLVDVFYVRPAGRYVELKEPDSWPRVWRFRLWLHLGAPTPTLKLAHNMGTDNRKGNR